MSPLKKSEIVALSLSYSLPKTNSVRNISLSHSLLMISIFLSIGFMGCQNSDKASQKDSTTGLEDEKMKKVTLSDVESGIRSYIKEQTEKGTGTFTIEEDSLERNLRLVRVHTEYLSVLGPNRFFACVDLADDKGDVYDVDFFLEGQPGNMEVTETSLHKLNGKPFYTWKQQTDKTWERVPVEGAGNELLGVVEGTDTFTFLYEARIPQIKKEAQMWIPIAESDAFQKVEILDLQAPGEKRMLRDSLNGNKILHLDLESEHSDTNVRIQYKVVRMEKSAYEGDAPDAADLASTPLLPTGGRFKDIVDSVLEKKQAETPLVKARALYDYIIDNVRYAKQGTYGTGDANFACDSKSGNCTEFHSLFISLARTADIPARFAIGAAIPSERDEGGVNGYHCWAEFYADGKWWPVDISEGNKYTALATYYFGHHPANRIELSKGRDIAVKPGPKEGAIPFLAYPVFETGGFEMPVITSFSFERK